MPSDIYLAAMHGVGRLLRRFGAVVFDRRTQRLFNGVLIRHDGRHFVGTAAHCVNDFNRVEDLDGIEIMTADRRFAASATPVSAAFFRAGVHYDVGFLELSDESAAGLGEEWIDETAASSAEATPGRQVCCVGAPQHRVSPIDVLGHEVLQCQPDLVASSVTERDPDGIPDYDGDVDVLVEWPENYTDKEGRPLPPQGTFEGMSGCGVFLLPLMHEGQVWSPTDTELVGIFTGQYRKPRLWKFQRVELLLEGIRRHPRRMRRQSK